MDVDVDVDVAVDVDVDVDVNVEVDVDVAQDENEDEDGHQDLQFDFGWHLDGLARLFAQQNLSWFLPIFTDFNALFYGQQRVLRVLLHRPSHFYYLLCAFLISLEIVAAYLILTYLFLLCAAYWRWEWVPPFP